MAAVKAITLRLPGGAIRALSDGRIIRARGIRYAHAARFEKPEPVTTWAGIRDCTQPASVCPQNPSRLGTVTGDLEKGRLQDEDCLHVSVTAPASAKAAHVMVYLHGGAYVTGGGDIDVYSPHILASKGVVAVTVTHRLGVFGYLPIPNIAPANLGLLDQIEALKWIQNNIEVFGGDPANVTLFGQSAGADAIYCLLVADGTDHLLHRAVLQSLPLGRLGDDSRDEMTRSMSERASQALSSENPATVPVSRLLDLTKELLGLARTLSNPLLPYGPIFGEHPLPRKTDLHDRFMAAAKRKPLLLGYTANEETAFTHIDTREGASTYLYNLFQGATDILIRQMAKELGRAPPSYELAWYPKGSDKLRATHCLELPLLLGDWAAWKDAPMLQGQGAQEVIETVGSAVKDFWVAFARGEDLGSKKFIIDENFRWPSPSSFEARILCDRLG